MNYNDNLLKDSNMNSPKRKVNKFVIVIFFIGILLVLGGIASLVVSYFSSKENRNKDFDIEATTSFFLENPDSKYALFNEEGKQLTEFIYTSVGSFVNGTAVVKQEEKEGIIDCNGKLVVPLGKYKYISSKGGVYQVNEETKDSFKKYLINSQGKILYDLENVDIDSYIGINTFLILEFEEENKYAVINYQGKQLVSFPKVEDDDVESPSVNEENGFISVFYNKKNWIFDVMRGTQVTSFDSDLHYCVNRVSDDKNIITLNSCVSWGQSQNKVYYKFIKDGKLYDKTDECDKVWQDNGNLVCSKDYKEFLLDSKLKVGLNKSGLSYVNSDTYAENTSTPVYGVNFYQNGKLVKNVSCRDLKEQTYNKEGIYILSTHYNRQCNTESGMYDYYKENGEKLIEKTFARAENFDSNGLAKVSEDKKNYYLINKSGKQVSGSYDNIVLFSDYYVTTKSTLKGLLNTSGKEIVSNKYKEITIYGNKKSALLITEDSKYIVYDLEKEKETLNLIVAPNMNESWHYIKTTSNGKTQYYTYSGKLFFEK